jgi:probable rRNA maturation factor
MPATKAETVIMPELDIQINVEDEGWPEEPVLLALTEKTLAVAAAFLSKEEGQPFPQAAPELSLVFTGDEAIREINAEWRGQDKPTNVLSFPAFPLQPGGMPGPMLGDIVVARETVEREAVDLEKSFDDHLTHLLVHGFLHLFGYDHMEKGDAETMEALETRILAELGLSDPYAGQDPIV